MPLWVYAALAVPGIPFGNIGGVVLISMMAEQAKSKPRPRPPRGGKRIPLPLPVGA